VLLEGVGEAILIDGGWTFQGGRFVADAIRRTRKSLSTIYVSRSSPDFYFSLLPIISEFPDAKVLAAPSIIEAIRASARRHLEVWGPHLRDNGPRSLSEIVIPEPHSDSNLLLEGNVVNIVEAEAAGDHCYLYVPVLNAVFGGGMLFSGLHVWTADTSTLAERTAWVSELDALAEKKPAIVVPGHMTPHASLDSSSIVFTREYLFAFEEECAKGNGSEALISAMSRRYPGIDMRIALAIGAKVAKGEMNWKK
jgi:glyoxylase-like metal-dependent hydrolase (beta-lactamase superfamily II)